MRRRVDILIAYSEKHLHYSLFVKRIIAIEAQLYFLGLHWSDYKSLKQYCSVHWSEQSTLSSLYLLFKSITESTPSHISAH